MTTALEVSNLKYKYPTAKTLALDNLSLKIKKGEHLGLLGPNGAGKTTLINFICGQKKFTQGKLVIHCAKQKIGYCPQNLALFTTLSAADNLKFFAKMAGVSADKISSQIEQVLNFVDLSELKHQKVFEFSGGMKRRLNLAVALLNEPELLILDEPTVGVDTQSRDIIYRQLKNMKSSGVTLIYTTHYLEEIEKLCDQIAVINRGQILIEAPIDEFKMQGSGIEGHYKLLIEKDGTR